MSDEEILKWIYENTNGVHIYPTNIDLKDARSPFSDDYDKIKIRVDLKNCKSYVYLFPIEGIGYRVTITDLIYDLIKDIVEVEEKI